MYPGVAVGACPADEREELLSIVIGLGGHLGAGKDEVADHLVAEHGFVKMGMSDPLADALYILNPRINIGWGNEASETVKGVFIPGMIYFYQDIVETVGYVEAKTVKEIRRWLQVLGTEVGRQLIDEDVWVKAARKKISNLQLAGHYDVVITGIRYPNELQMLKDDGNVSAFIRRPGFAGDAHSSEQSLKAEDFNFIIDNHGTLEDLRENVDGFIEHLKSLS